MDGKIKRKFKNIKESAEKYYSKTCSTVLSAFLNIAIVFLIILVIGTSIGVGDIIFHQRKLYYVINAFVWDFVYLIYFFIAYILRRVLISIKTSPFCSINAKRFKKIGFLMFLAALLDAISNYRTGNTSNLVILSTGHGSLKGSFFVYFALACMCFILAEIFEKAIKIKEENDLTV